MALELDHLDAVTRPHMLNEVNRDIDNKTLYRSRRLTSVGHTEYPGLLKEAVSTHDDDWLAHKIRENGLLVFQETSSNKGKPYLAQGEFNRFYIRGLCLRAIDEGIESLVICRVKQVTNPRPESQAKIGREINPTILLNDLRTNIGVDTALGLPAGPNSGLSVTLG